MIGAETIGSYTVVAVLGAMSPGPDFALVSRFAALRGRRVGLGASAGVAAGMAVNTLAAVAGVGAVVAASPTLFRAMSLVGAAYLIYLGVRALLALRAEGGAAAVPPAVAALGAGAGPSAAQGVSDSPSVPPAGRSGTDGAADGVGDGAGRAYGAVEGWDPGAAPPAPLPDGRRSNGSGRMGRGKGEETAWLAFRQGLVTNVLNPKSVVFLVALLPQFLTDDSTWGDKALLGAITVLAVLVWFGCVALAVGALQAFFRRPAARRGLNAITGILLVGLGVSLFVVG